MAVSPPLADAGGMTGSFATDMVGRAREMQVLQEAVEQTRSGRRRAVFACGPAGVGKTRLLQEAVRQMASPAGGGAAPAAAESRPRAPSRGTSSAQRARRTSPGASRTSPAHDDDCKRLG